MPADACPPKSYASYASAVGGMLLASCQGHAPGPRRPSRCARAGKHAEDGGKARKEEPMIDKTVQNLAGTARTHAMKVRLTAAEAETLQRKAEQAGLNGAEFVRRAALGARFASPRRVRIDGMPALIKVSGLLGHLLRELEDVGRRMRGAGTQAEDGNLQEAGTRVLRLLPELARLYRQTVSAISALQVQGEDLHGQLNGGAEAENAEEEKPCQS